jgi:biotin operon repressor
MTDHYIKVHLGLVQELDIYAAQVYGWIEYRCNRPSKCCEDSLQFIADHLGMSAKTVGRKIELLIEKGYITKRSRGRTMPACLSTTDRESLGQSVLRTESPKTMDTESLVESDYGQRVPNLRTQSPTRKNKKVEPKEVKEPESEKPKSRYEERQEAIRNPLARPSWMSDQAYWYEPKKKWVENQVLQSY